MPAADLLFVYGTLRRGGSNDIARIAPDATFVSAARVRGRLYDVNGRWPSLVLDRNADWVTGELYHIPLEAWSAIDALEDPVTTDNPNGPYFNDAVMVERDGQMVAATVYTANPAATRLVDQITSGDWIAHARHLARENWNRG